MTCIDYMDYIRDYEKLKKGSTCPTHGHSSVSPQHLMWQTKYWHFDGQKYTQTPVVLNLITFNLLVYFLLICRAPQHQVALSSFLNYWKTWGHLQVQAIATCVRHFYFSLKRNTDCLISQQLHQVKPLAHRWKIIDEGWALPRHRLNRHKEGNFSFIFKTLLVQKWILKKETKNIFS